MTTTSTPIPFPMTDTDLKIDVPRNSTKDEIASSHRRQSSHVDKSATTSAAPTWQYNPRQPGPSSDSYFPGSAGAKKHGRNMSQGGSAMPMSLNLAHAQQDDVSAHFGTFGLGGGPPSPSTLTDVILGLHSTFYSGKRKPEQVSDMVARYYESNAVFESPLLSAHGRDQIANQFIMAFALPGMDVKSELRDVICSDFEFDGTRAGIIDHAVTVTFLPSLFGSAQTQPGPSDIHPAASHSHGAAPPQIGSGMPMTPHPFIDYNSAFSRLGAQSHPHSPTTPYSTWGGNSQAHTPGPGGMRPFSSAHGDDGESHSTMVPNTQAYVEADTIALRPAIPADALTPHWTQQGLGRGTLRNALWSLFHPRTALKSLFSIQLRVMSRLEFNDAGLIVRHEDSWGLREAIEGVIPLASLVYSIERRLVGFLVSWAVAKGFRVSSTLLLKSGDKSEKEDLAQHVSQHDAESIYHPLHSHLHNHLHQHAHLHQHHSQHHHHHHHAAQAHPQNLAFTPASASGHYRQRDFYTISRSRATSPTRFRFGSHNGSELPRSGIVTGTRSRARSLVGHHSMASSRAMSTDNLVALGQAEQTTRSRNAELPPDSSAKFRERTAKRLEGGRTSSAPPSAAAQSPPPIDGAYNGNLAHMWDHLHNFAQPAHEDPSTPFRAPDQDPH